MRLAGITTSLVDWPGQVSAVMFFAGCNFRCGYCHNSELISKDAGRYYHYEEVEKILREYSRTIDSVVMCGGEPTLQSFQLYAEVLPIAKDIGLRSKLDTNGSRSNTVLRCLQGGLDKISLDVKARPDREAYNMVIGHCSNNAHPLVDIMRTMRYAKKYNVELEVRTTVVPGLNNNPKHIREIVEFVKDYATEFTLQTYNNANVYHPLYGVIKSPTKEEMMDLASVADEHIDKVNVK